MSATAILHRAVSPVRPHATDMVLQLYEDKYQPTSYRNLWGLPHVIEPTLILTLLVKWSSW